MSSSVADSDVKRSALMASFGRNQIRRLEKDFRSVKGAYETMRVWLKWMIKKITDLEAHHAHGFTCHCLQCISQWNRMSRCVACNGLSNRAGHQNCGLYPGCLSVRRSFPNLWAKFVKMLAEVAAEEIRKEGLLAGPAPRPHLKYNRPE